MKEKKVVKLRQKKERTGKVSLFLDKYINGKRQYEYLRMYLTGNKEEDKITMAVAEKICEERNRSAIVELQRDYNDLLRNITIHRFVDLHCPSLYQKIKYWINEDDKVCDIDKDYERLFIQKMIDSNLNNNTKKNYISIFRTIKNRAIDMDAISLYKSPRYTIKATPHERQFLSVEEIKTLANLELIGDYKITRDAFCFACLTGLRVSDLRALRWDNITEQDGYKRIVYKQTKTRSREYLDISDNAYKFLGQRCNGKVFDAVLNNYKLGRIVELAGIKKNITFHCARHTFAIMMLGLGVDIYTLSKLLGHSDIAITQVYARILDKNKRSAVDLIPKI